MKFPVFQNKKNQKENTIKCLLLIINYHRYWSGNQEFYGFGMSAASLIHGFRYTRPKNIKKYYQYVDRLKDEQFLDIMKKSGEDETNEL